MKETTGMCSVNWFELSSYYLLFLIIFHLKGLVHTIMEDPSWNSISSFRRHTCQTLERPFKALVLLTASESFSIADSVRLSTILPFVENE